MQTANAVDTRHILAKVRWLELLPIPIAWSLWPSLPRAGICMHVRSASAQLLLRLMHASSVQSSSPPTLMPVTYRLGAVLRGRLVQVVDQQSRAFAHAMCDSSVRLSFL